MFLDWTEMQMQKKTQALTDRQTSSTEETREIWVYVSKVRDRSVNGVDRR